MRLVIFRLSMLALFLAALSQLLPAQQLANPSFEGRRGPSVAPPAWEPCGQGSTPDTQPGAWQVYTPPAEGQAYLSLICRGDNVPYPQRWEIVQQALQSPLEQGLCYKYTLDLARSETFVAGSIFFTGAASLRIWGGAAPCTQQELLWESGPIAHADWRTYDLLLWPQAGSYDYLLLEAYYSSRPAYSGNILLDNFVFYPEVYPCLFQARTE